MANLRITLAGLDLDNPIMLASGILDSTPGILQRMAETGAGALITKSISLKPRPGYPGPTTVEIAPGTWINAMGLPNPGLEEFLNEFGGNPIKSPFQDGHYIYTVIAGSGSGTSSVSPILYIADLESPKNFYKKLQP